MTEETVDPTADREQSDEAAQSSYREDRRGRGLYLTGSVATEQSGEQIPVIVATAEQTLGETLILIGPNNLGHLANVKLTIRDLQFGAKVLRGKTLESRHGARHDDAASVGDWFFTRFVISELSDITH